MGAAHGVQALREPQIAGLAHAQREVMRKIGRHIAQLRADPVDALGHARAAKALVRLLPRQLQPLRTSQLVQHVQARHFTVHQRAVAIEDDGCDRLACHRQNRAWRCAGNSAMRTAARWCGRVAPRSNRTRRSWLMLLVSNPRKVLRNAADCTESPIRSCVPARFKPAADGAAPGCHAKLLCRARAAD